MLASFRSAPTVLRSRPAPRARPARCPPALRSQQPETSAPRPRCARGAQVLPHVLPGILSLSGPRESIPGPGLPETNAKLVARRDGRLAYYAQRRGGVPRNSSGGPPPGRAARPGDSSRPEEMPPPDAARRFRDASAAGAVPARGPQHAGVALMRAKPGRPLLAARALLPPGLVFGSANPCQLLQRAASHLFARRLHARGVGAELPLLSRGLG